MSAQRQGGGDDSVNIQAGNDVVIQNGADLTEVKTYVLGLFHENFTKLQGVARQTVDERIDRLTEDLMDRLGGRNSSQLAPFTEPAVQQTVFEAQKAFAMSGEDDLADTLTDLIVDRSEQPGRSLRALALEEAVKVVGRLTDVQRAALGFIFAMRYVVTTASSREEYFTERIRMQLVPFLAHLQGLRRVDLQHLQFLGLGTIEMGEVSFARCLRSEALFSAGLPIDQVPEGLRTKGFATQSDDDPARWVMRPMIVNLLRHNPDALGEDGPTVLQLAEQSAMGDDAAYQICAQAVPELLQLSELWEQAAMKAFTLTSVGLALGHTYWKQVASQSAPLSIWL